MRRTAVIDVVGLTSGLLRSSLPRLASWSSRGAVCHLGGVTPAVTCSVQATYLTGQYPTDHGIVGNGWYFRDEGEIKFWRQSNQLVQVPKIWDLARRVDPEFTCANLFWWYNMYSTVDYSVTPRPIYTADGRKFPDIYAQPANLRGELTERLGTFPLFDFWGPKASIKSSQWIAQAAKVLESKYRPTLSLVYLPHLDYGLQRLGPSHPSIHTHLQEIDEVCSELIQWYERLGIQVILLSEYGITPVSKPVHLNRNLREAGLLAVRDELGLELLDTCASRAFAVADHQIAHVYIRNPALTDQVRLVLERTDGVEMVLDARGKEEYHLDHPRAGDLVTIARPDAWFTYYYWIDDKKAPDFARTVDIHRKPGYDPAELFIDPVISLPKLKLARTLLKKKLGFRYLMDVIPLDGSLVKGSHGRITEEAEAPVLITQRSDLVKSDSLRPTDVCPILLQHLAN
jgi:predicted AlkP superfamily pyrophosphatase or phosphodiesterase